MSPYYQKISDKVKYLFIDGACLDSLLKKFSEKLFENTPIQMDYTHLAQGYHKIFYYDCLPTRKGGESEKDYNYRIEPKVELFNNLKSIDRFHVYEGTGRYRNKKQEQKQVDILIAVDMLTHTFHRNMDEATLLSGDLDFKPLIDALVQNGMYVSLWYPKGETNYELIDAADSRKPLTINEFQQWFNSDFLTKFKLPELSIQPCNNYENSYWNFLEEIKEKTYEVRFYEIQGKYIGVVSNTVYGYLHGNLDQLKFYINHIHSPNMVRTIIT